MPTIWIPDGKTSSCLRCGRSFGWRRRRHHCCLCGRCIRASCSGRVRSSIVVVYAFITCCAPTLCIDGDRHDDMYAFDVRHVVWAFGESYLFISLFFKILKDVFWLYVGSNCYICDVGVSDGNNGAQMTWHVVWPLVRLFLFFSPLFRY